MSGFEQSPSNRGPSGGDGGDQRCRLWWPGDPHHSSAPQQCLLPGSSVPLGGPPRVAAPHLKSAPFGGGGPVPAQKRLAPASASAPAREQLDFGGGQRGFGARSLCENERRPWAPRPPRRAAPSPPPRLSSSSPFPPLLRVTQAKLVSPLRAGPVEARRALAERLGARGWPSGVLPGPQAEPGTSLPAAAARPRLRLGSQRGSAWGAAAAGSAGPSSEAAERGAGSPGSAGAPRPSLSLAAPGFLPPSARLLGPGCRRTRAHGGQKARERAATFLPGRAPREPGATCPRPESPGEGATAPREPPDAGERRRRRVPSPGSSATPAQPSASRGPSPAGDLPAGGIFPGILQM